MTGRIVAGVDSSTQATKVVLVDLDEGAVLAIGRAEHEVAGTGGARESDPRQWWTALCAAFGQALSTVDSARVAALAVGGQQHGLVPLDRSGAPVRAAMLWNDVRSAPQASALTAALGAPAWAERTGTVPVASLTAAKWAWLREHEPRHARATAAIRLPHDYLTERLTGRGVTDRGDASGTGWYGRDGYDPTILALPALDLDPALLPAVLAPEAVAGELTAAAAAELGLPAGIPVGAGTGDNMAAALGLGLGPGEPVLSLGTSGTVYAVSTKPPADPTGTVAGFADATGNHLPLACTLNCTQAVDQLAALLGRDRESLEPGGAVVVLPFLGGERTPNLPLAAGLVTGLRADTTAGQVLRAAYEGAAFALLRALDAVLEQSGVDGREEPLLLLGGGARGAAWRATVLRLSGRAVQVPAAAELVALGAAVQAAWCLTGEPPQTVARRWNTRRGDLLDPVPVDTQALDRLTATLTRANPLLDPTG